MNIIRLLAALAAAAATLGAATPAHAQNADAITALLRRVEQVVQAGDAAGYLALLTDSADRTRSREFAATELSRGVSRAVIQERDREPLRGTLPGDGYRLMVDVFSELGDRSRVSTWRLDIK